MADGQLAWSQIRLFNEAHIDNHIECTKWLIGKGIFKGPSICELHNRRRVLFCRKNGQYPLWRCRECRSRPLPVAEGSIISGSRMPIGKVMMVALCFAQNATYDELGFTHSTVNHSAGQFVAPDGTTLKGSSRSGAR